MTWRSLSRSAAVALSLAVATPALSALAAQSPPPGHPALPPSALIRGVPYVSFHEANEQDYENQRIRNPSLQAVYEMVAWYWNDRVHSLRDAERLTRDRGWKRVAFEDSTTSVGVSTLDSIRSLVARGIPVEVGPALTPVAHTAYPVWKFTHSMGVLKDWPLVDGPRSGTLGEMLPLDSVARFAAVLRRDLNLPQDFNPLHESAIRAERLVIGYDDARQVLVMHDPTFGPAFEASYADFERMWSSAGRPGVAVLPPGYEGIVARHAAAPERYRDRIPDERAAWEYVNGYALSATGRPLDGIARFRAGLGVPGISAGYRHLLLFDLALSLVSQDRIDEAVAAADSSAALIPDDARVWTFLAEAYTRCGLADRDARGRQAADRAHRLAKDARARDRAVSALPHDFLIWGM